MKPKVVTNIKILEIYISVDDWHTILKCEGDIIDYNTYKKKSGQKKKVSYADDKGWEPY